jgi:hypothetical protein
MKKFTDMMFTATNGEQFWITSELQERLYKAMARCLLSTDLFQSPASQRRKSHPEQSIPGSDAHSGMGAFPHFCGVEACAMTTIRQFDEFKNLLALMASDNVSNHVILLATQRTLNTGKTHLLRDAFPNGGKNAWFVGMLSLHAVEEFIRSNSHKDNLIIDGLHTLKHGFHKLFKLQSRPRLICIAIPGSIDLNHPAFKDVLMVEFDPSNREWHEFDFKQMNIDPEIIQYLRDNLDFNKHRPVLLIAQHLQQLKQDGEDWRRLQGQ